MKKLLLCTGVMFMTLLSAEAQNDTTEVQPATPQVESGTESLNDSLRQSGKIRKEDRVEIKKDELPAAVRSTLVNKEEYKGWEEAAVYYDRTTGQYMLHIADGNSTRTYRFTEDGRPVTGSHPVEE